MILIDGQTPPCIFVATGTGNSDFLRRQTFPGGAAIVARQTCTGQERLYTP